MITERDIELAAKIIEELNVYLEQKTGGIRYHNKNELINFMILKIAMLENKILDICGEKAAQKDS